MTRPDGSTSAPRPVRFLVHGAERTGPPIFLLRLLQAWRATSSTIEPQVLLARGGPLEGAFGAVAPTRTAGLHRRSPERLAQRAFDAVGRSDAGTALVDAATRRRVGRTSRRGGELTVVNGATAPTADLLRALAPTGDVAMIAHELGTGWFENLDAPRRELLLERTNRYLAVSRCVATFLHEELGVPTRRISVTRPPVPPARSPCDGVPGPPSVGPAPSTAAVVVGGAGVHDWRKAPELWLQLAARVRDRMGPGRVRFVWFGGHDPGGAPAWPIRHELRSLGLEGDVRFAGEVGDLSEHLGGVDVFVTTAREDAYPLVCAEACAAGVPVVTFRGGGAEELVTDADCGRAVAYPDLDEMARRVVQLAEDEQMRRRLADNGRRFGQEHFDPAAVAAGVQRWLMGEPV